MGTWASWALSAEVAPSGDTLRKLFRRALFPALGLAVCTSDACCALAAILIVKGRAVLSQPKTNQAKVTCLGQHRDSLTVSDAFLIPPYVYFSSPLCCTNPGW
mmetsp:Transcript_38933/g.87049  ORF Transcript_38933/g.87049 Transcript_38933/m.87049 type:complete len:103 (+) Transcript_38933:402-710(+)